MKAKVPNVQQLKQGVVYIMRGRGPMMHEGDSKGATKMFLQPEGTRYYANFSEVFDEADIEYMENFVSSSRSRGMDAGLAVRWLEDMQAIAQKKTNPVFTAMVHAAHALGWPTSYREDLTKHDHRIIVLSGDPPEKFGWVVRSMGTHMLDTRMDSVSRWGFLEHLDREKDSEIDPRAYFVHDGYSLMQCQDFAEFQRRFLSMCEK